MNCFRPKRIRNKYTDDWLYVACRQCDACKINAANQKAALLAEDLKKYKYCYFIRLGYNNDSVPFIIPGMNGIFRESEFVHIQGDYIWQKSDFTIRIDDSDNSDIDFSKCRSLRKHYVNNAVGVLYYEDFKDFFKRLRRYYGKERIGFKYALGLEYGPRTFRPHAHLIIYSNDSRFTFETIKSALVECWPLQNWFRSGNVFNEELCKRCDAKTAFYIASYVSGNICSCGVSEVARFRQKITRSKDIDFGIAKQSKDKIERFIFGEFDKELSRIGNRVFEVVDCSKFDRISVSPIPSRYFYSFFPRYSKYGKTSPGSFKTRARHIYSLITYGNKKDLLESGELSSLDVNFYNGFERFKKLLFNREIVSNCGHFDLIKYDDLSLFESYLNLHQVATSLYNSLCLKYEMMQYESLGKVNYFLSKINTHAEDLEKRIIKISRYCGSPQSTYDVNCPPYIRSALKNKCNKYYYKLLPKHFNQLIYDFV